MAERRIEYPSRAEISFPGQRPTIEALMDAGLAEVHRALVEAQENPRAVQMRERDQRR